jgi:hypothetical protein
LSEQTTPRDDAGRFTAPAPEQYRAIEVSDAMAKAVDAGGRPSDAFQEMPPNTPAPKDETFGSDVHGLKSAAAELQMHREAKAEPVPREYGKTVDGRFTGEKSDITQTIDLERASSDLADQRRAERHAQEALEALHHRQEIDKFRSDADRQALLEAHQPVDPQPEQTAPQQTNGVDPEVARALENPKVREAINQQIQQSEIARQQYMAALHQVSQIQAAAITNQFPELAGATQETLPAVLNAINARDPARAQAIVNHLQSASKQIEVTNQQIRAEQQRAAQQAQQQFSAYATLEDSKFSDFENSRPAGEARQVRANLETVLREDFDIDPGALLQLYNSNPALRSAEAQKLIYSAVRASLAERAVRNTTRKGLPPVSMRPGAGYDHASGESVVVANKMRDFASDPTAKKAGAALAARRRMAALNRR